VQPELLRCKMCSDLQGAIVHTNLGWVHITCVNWTPDIWFADEEKTRVEGKINTSRFQLNCSICKRQKSGTCIQCDYKDCSISFHVRCAMRKELIRDWEAMSEHRENEEAHDCFVFCAKHIEKGRDTLKRFGAAGLEGQSDETKAALSKRRATKSKKNQVQRKQKKARVDDTFIDDANESEVDEEEEQ